MPTWRWILMTLLTIVTLWAGAQAHAADHGPTRGPRYSYGYYPYKHHYGPIEAQGELDGLTYRPGIRGVDDGYGLGYFFGGGPAHHYHGWRGWHAK